jgi:hypothetical protein
MSTLGETLREARLAKGSDPSTAAIATRLKVQIIEDLEADDFSSMAAPVYAKGFIKLYAEYLELDPAPLIQAYLVQTGASPRPSSTKGKAGSAGREGDAEEAPRKLKKLGSGIGRIVPRGPKPDLDEFVQLRLERMRIAFIEEPVKCSLIAFAVLVLLVFLASGLARCAGF